MSELDSPHGTNTNASSVPAMFKTIMASCNEILDFNNKESIAGSNGFSEDRFLHSNKCNVCSNAALDVKIFSCFHVVCLNCLGKTLESDICPICSHDSAVDGCDSSTTLSSEFGLLSFNSGSNLINSVHKKFKCTACKSSCAVAIGRCTDCVSFLCNNCVLAHKYMLCFQKHSVLPLNPDTDDSKNESDEEQLSNISSDYVNNKVDSLLSRCEVNKSKCDNRFSDYTRFFCRTCNLLLFKENYADHELAGHQLERSDDECFGKFDDVLKDAQISCRHKPKDLNHYLKMLDKAENLLQVQYHKAASDIRETYNFFKATIEDRKQELLKNLDEMYQENQVTLNCISHRLHEVISKLCQRSFDIKLPENIGELVNANSNQVYFEFISNYQAIKNAVRNTFGYIKYFDENEKFKSEPIGTPSPLSTLCSVSSKNNIDSLNSLMTPPIFHGENFNFNCTDMRKMDMNSCSSINNLPSITSDFNPFSFWIQEGMSNPSTRISNELLTEQVSTKIQSYSRPTSHVKRQKMVYHCKFGEFGGHEGQFTEPSGLTVNGVGDIIVADTNNHRIQVFDKDGRYRFLFGECGKRDGQLLYPNRVAVFKTSGDIVVTERSPTHQVQIYNQYGQFIRKFGSTVLQHPRGVCVDNNGNIVVAECKVMRIFIFDQYGNVINRFNCSKYLEFPNSVCVNDRQEIFISDNRAHCVKVFSYEGRFLRTIGGEGVTNFPISVGINEQGEVLVADNHNNFNLTIFTQDGQLISALESKVKHAQCFDAAIMDNNSIVLSSKDYHVYVYRYGQVVLPMF